MTARGMAGRARATPESLPDFLQRAIRGATDSEHAFAVLLSFLHDAGQLDRPDADPKVVLGAIRSTVALLDRFCAEVGAPEPSLNLMLTNGRELYALRRGGHMYYAQRSSTPPGGGALRYVLLCSDGETVPTGFTELEASSILVVDRNLDVTIQAL